MNLQPAVETTAPTKSIREHQWGPVPNPHPTYDERDCPICGLHDFRVRATSDQPKERAWRVNVPCIEPVPERMTYEDFLRDLDTHGFKRERQPRAYHPYVVGRPGDWSIGFSHAGQHGGTRMDPAIKVVAPLEMDHGWPLVLRWVRARQYDPYRYEYLESLDARGFELTPPPCLHEDD